MDPLRIVIRVVFAYVVLLVFTRLGGKRTVNHASTFDFVLALIIGDLVDDLFWGEVNAATFVVATSVLFLVHMSLQLGRYRFGSAR